MQIAEIVRLFLFSGHSVERGKSYIINIFFFAKWQDPKSVISKHNHAHVKSYFKMLKSGSTISVIIKQKENMLSGSLCKRNKQFAKTVGLGSILGRNRFGTKIGKLNKHGCFSTIGFGCWSLTAYRNH